MPLLPFRRSQLRIHSAASFQGSGRSHSAIFFACCLPALRQARTCFQLRYPKRIDGCSVRAAIFHHLLQYPASGHFRSTHFLLTPIAFKWLRQNSAGQPNKSTPIWYDIRERRCNREAAANFIIALKPPFRLNVRSDSIEPKLRRFSRHLIDDNDDEVSHSTIYSLGGTHAISLGPRTMRPIEPGCF